MPIINGTSSNSQSLAVKLLMVSPVGCFRGGNEPEIVWEIELVFVWGNEPPASPVYMSMISL